MLVAAGAQPGKPTRFAPLFTARFFVGLWTNRNLLRSPLPTVYADGWHLGATDVLLDGVNTELGTRLTLSRRPGCPAYSTASVQGIPLNFYSFQHADGTTFDLVMDTTSEIDLLTPTASTLISTKSTSNQSFFQSVGDQLYWGNGVDVLKYLPTNPNTNPDQASRKVWNTGIAAPTAAPTLTITPAANVASQNSWQANTVFSTMGIVVDNSANKNAWQLIRLINPPFPFPNIGTSGVGQPDWNQTTGGTTAEQAPSTLVWTNMGPLSTWQPNTTYANAGNNSPASTDASAFIVNVNPDGSVAIYGNVSPSGEVLTTGTFQPKPNFNNIPGGPTLDTSTVANYISGRARWWCFGQILAPGGGKGSEYDSLWKNATSYTLWGPPSQRFGVNAILEPALPTKDFDPKKINIYVQKVTTAGTTATVASPFPAVSAVADQAHDNQLVWINLGSTTWIQSTNYILWQPGVSTFSVVRDPDTGGGGLGCLFVATNAQTNPPNSGLTRPAIWWKAGNSYTGSANASTAPVVVDSKGFLQRLTTDGSSAPATPPNWSSTIGATTSEAPQGGTAVWTNIGTAYGAKTTDSGGIEWTCIGTSMGWLANTQYFLIPTHWSPPSQSNSEAGASIIATAANAPAGGAVEFVLNSGKSGAVQPTWPSTTGNPNLAANLTADGGITWLSAAAFIQAPAGSLAATGWSRGFTYAYSYKARTVSDPFVTTAPPGFVGFTGQGTALGSPTGSADGSVSTASPTVSTAVGANSGSVIDVTVTGSPDKQVDTIIIWRTLDSGAQLFELTEIKNPGVKSGNPQTFTFRDILPDSATGSFPGLNTLILAPIAHKNDPPPGQVGSLITGGIINLTYHLGRIWGSVGSDVYASAGPDLSTIPGFPGNGNTAWPPGNVFHFPSTVKRLLSLPQGLLVFTTTDLFVILGGPAIVNFFPSPYVWGLGVLSYNAVAIEGNIIYVFTSDHQMISLDPSAGVTQVGQAIGDQFARIPASVTNTSLTSNVATYTAVNTFAAGYLVTVVGSTHDSTFNIQNQPIVSATPTSFTVAITHADIGSAADTASAVGKWNPANVYVAAHIQGAEDQAVYFADGVTGWFRCTPHLPPDSSLTGPVWSPKANIAGGGGARAVQSVLVGLGDHRLMVGPATTSLTTASDNFARGPATTLGPNWAPTGNHKISAANRVQAPATGTISSTWVGSTFGGDHSSKITVRSLVFSTNGSPYMGPAVRAQQDSSGGNGYTASQPAHTTYAFTVGADFTRSNGNILGTSLQLHIVKYTAPSSNPVNLVAPVSMVINAGDTMELVATGITLTGKVNGVAVITATDSSLVGGEPGIVLTIPNGAATSDAELDTWVGSSNSANIVLARDSQYTVFADNGVSYPAFFTFGNMVFAHPGQMAELAFLTMDFKKVGSPPTISVLFDELFATTNTPFEKLSDYVVTDPPKKFGQNPSQSMFMNRYYFSQTVDGAEPQPAWCRSMQCKVDFGSTDSVQNEILTMTVFGSVYHER